MTETSTENRVITVERELPYPPEKIWRALTQPHLIEAWLMKNDFAPVIGHRFDLTADWGSIDCQVLEIEEHATLAYSWVSTGLESVVTWTLKPTETGTLLSVHQSGFGPDQQQAYHGAKAGWPRFLGKLETVLAETQA